MNLQFVAEERAACCCMHCPAIVAKLYGFVVPGSNRLLLEDSRWIRAGRIETDRDSLPHADMSGSAEDCSSQRVSTKPDRSARWSPLRDVGWVQG